MSDRCEVKKKKSYLSSSARLRRADELSSNKTPPPPPRTKTRNPNIAEHPWENQAELREASASRRELVERVEQKNAEIAEKTKTVEGYLAQVVRASEERTRVEGQPREANNSRAAFESAKARMEQEATLLQQHNEWLRSELAKKSEELLAARKKGSHDARRC